MEISVIVPAYNEEGVLEKNIILYDNYLKASGLGYELIIVNDGSTDDTGKICDALSRANPRVRCIHKEINAGKGSAIREGFLNGSGEFLLFIDADNATSIDHLEKAWPLLKSGYDMVIGSRNKKDIAGAGQIKSQNIIKRLLGISGNKLIRALTGSDIYDTQCGFKVFSKKSRDLIIPQTKINRWAIDVEILLLAKHHKLQVGIIPVTWHCGPKSHVGIKGYFIALSELIRMKFTKY